MVVEDLRGVDPRLAEQRANLLEIVMLLQPLHRHKTGSSASISFCSTRST